MSTLQAEGAPCQPEFCPPTEQSHTETGSFIEESGFNQNTCRECQVQDLNENVCQSCLSCQDCCNCVKCDCCQSKVKTADVCEVCIQCNEDCCDCYYCNNCERRRSINSHRCSNCDDCDDCCECRYCERCESYLDPDDDYCGNCDNCTECCDCSNHDAPVKFFTSPVYFHRSAPGNFNRNRSRRFLSCEIEVAEIDDDSETSEMVEKWRGSIVSDGSLPDTGFEINTAPANGDLFVNQITEICSSLEKDYANVNDDCGLHVHIDARDFTYYDLRRFVLLYERIEPALFEMMPYSRRESNYCKPCGRLYADAARTNRFPKIYKGKLIQAVYGLEASRPPRDVKHNDARYHALNLHSWFYRGTIECRLHTGTINPKKIIAWSKLWASILDSAMRWRESEIVGREDSGSELLLALAPDSETIDYINERHFRHCS